MLEDTTSKQNQLINTLEKEKQKMENDLDNFKRTKVSAFKVGTNEWMTTADW